MGQGSKTGEGAEVDLFGQPVLPLRDPRGRPRFKICAENQRLVVTLAAANWSQERIANFMGCDPKTLRANFSRELQMGADYLEGMTLQVMTKRALEGHLPSLVELRKIIGASNPPRATHPAQPKKPEALGKKDQLARDARAAPAAWGDLLN